MTTHTCDGDACFRRAIARARILTASAAAQTTIFTTPDGRQPTGVERWTDPAYYRNNTVGQLRGMAIGTEPGGGSTQQANSEYTVRKGQERSEPSISSRPIRPRGSVTRRY